MFRAILATQWKWSRGIVMLAALAGFALPLASLQAGQSAYNPEDFVWRMQRWGASYAILAGTIGLLVALAAWGNDHRGRHVYALSLPVSRARYVMMRLGAGGAFMMIPVIAVLVAALLVAQFGGIPTGLHAYPIALTVRFALAAFVAYAIFFAISASTQKTAGVILGTIAAVLLAQYMIVLAGSDFDLLAPIGRFLFESPGVLSVFSGKWMLIDV